MASPGGNFDLVALAKAGFCGGPSRSTFQSFLDDNDGVNSNFSDCDDNETYEPTGSVLSTDDESNGDDSDTVDESEEPVAKKKTRKSSSDGDTSDSARPKRQRKQAASKSEVPRMDGVDCQTFEFSSRTRKLASEIEALQATVEPLGKFPESYIVDQNTDDTCNVCKIGCGNEWGFKILGLILNWLEQKSTVASFVTLYRSITNFFNDKVREINPKLLAIGEKIYDEWTYEEVHKHFGHHDVSVQRILIDQLRTTQSKQRYTHEQRTYHRLIMGEKKDETSDLRSETLFLRQGDYMLRVVDRLLKCNDMTARLNSGGGGSMQVSGKGKGHSEQGAGGAESGYAELTAILNKSTGAATAEATTNGVIPKITFLTALSRKNSTVRHASVPMAAPSEAFEAFANDDDYYVNDEGDDAMRDTTLAVSYVPDVRSIGDSDMNVRLDGVFVDR